MLVLHGRRRGVALAQWLSDVGALGIEWAPSGQLPVFSEMGDVSFSLEDERIIFRRFGTTPVARWPAAERLYKSAGLDARFVSYPGVAHAMSREMNADVERLFAERAHRQTTAG